MQDTNKAQAEKKPVPDLKVADFDVAAWIKEKWKEVWIREQPPHEWPLLYINSVPIATPGNTILISGKKKCRKTLFAIWLLSQYTGNLEEDSLAFDTEQGRYHTWQVADKIKQITGKQVPVFFLRGQSLQDRLDIISLTVEYWPTRPKIILIDGIRDLMSNFNDVNETTDLILWLEAITVKHNIVVIAILHTNKTDQNLRGHLGTELGNKCQTNILLDKDDKTQVTLVKCEDSRDIPFEGFAFQHDINGLPEVVGLPIVGEIISDDEKRNRLKFIFDDQLLSRTEVIKGIRNHFSVGSNKAESLLATFMRINWIIKSGKEHSKDVVYKLMI